MQLGWVELADFRSYRGCRLEPDAGVNVLIGPNGAGKTNFLEGVSYLSMLRSFRRVPDLALIHSEADRSVIRGSVDRASASSEIAVELSRSGRRRVEVNGKPLRGSGELPGHLRVVLFFPDDLDVVKRGPAGRRDFVDECAVQLWPGSAGDLADYGKVLRQRNALLRRSGPETEDTALDVWDERLSQAGGKVLARRAEALGLLSKTLSGIYSSLAGSEAEISLAYRSSWGGDPFDSEAGALTDQLREAAMEARSADKDRRLTTVGPHRDDPGWLLDDSETRTHLSQGEQRSLALSLRLSARQAILEQTGEPPILLLDDVFSELDPGRGAALTEVVPDGQTFITTTRDEEVPFSGRRWVVGDGEIR